MRRSITKLSRAAKRERALIESEEKAEKRLLKSRAALEKAQRRFSVATDRLKSAEERLRAAQVARAAGPGGNEPPAEA